jgi:N-dimethylarginine dimethylaminohydrolase
MNWGVQCDYDALTDVMVSAPDYYKWLPNCAVARSTIAGGAAVDLDLARSQHESLRRALESAGVRVHAVPPHSDLPDLSFTRDTTIMTPWGLLSCHMAAAERSAEVEHVEAYVRHLGVPLWHKITQGHLEGGDVCLLRPGIALIGSGGERTTREGAAEAADAFRDAGWDVRIYPFESYFLHLDTFFCMVAADAALVCPDVVEDELLDWIASLGVRMIPVGFKDMRRLAANVLALGDRRVLAAAHNSRANAAMREARLTVIEVDVAQFTLGGGGVHCLTMALARTPA